MANYNIDAIYNGNTSLPGTERVRIDSSGNIGIGTATPSTKLHIYENANRVTYISQNNNHTARFEAYGTATAIDTTASNGIFFRINSGDIVKFAADGNVGIGTSTATAPLHIYRASNPWIRVNGGGNYSYIQLDDGTSSGYLLKNTSSDTSNGALAGAMYTYTDSGKAFQHIHSGTPLFTILSGGNVGIGTTNPLAKLSVGTGSLADGNLPVQISSAGTNTERYFGINKNGAYGLIVGYYEGSSFSGVGAYIRQVTSDPIHFVVNNTTTAMSMISSGNVGIGTSSPSAKLDINGTSNFAANVYHSIGGQKFFAGSGGTYSYFYTGTTALNIINSNDTSTLITILNGGNVGIGTTSPNKKLQIIGSLGKGLNLYEVPIDNLVAVGTQAKRFEIARVFIDYNDWNNTGPVEIEVRESYYSDGRYKKYIVSYGYNSNNVGSLWLVEDTGRGANDFKAEIGAAVLISGDIYYVPIYIDLDYYQYVDVLVRTNRPRTTNASSTSGGVIYINESPTGSNISSFSPDEVTYISLASSKTYLGYSGNVGIGTSSPSNKLEVKGADNAAITAIFQSTAGGNAAYNGGIQLGNAASSQNSQIYHDSSGDNTLTFVSNYGSGTGNKFIFSPGGTEKVRFQQNGNVGIGTTVPRQILHINGSILLDGLQNGYEQGSTRGIGYGSNSGAVNTDGFSGMDIQSVNAPAPNGGNYSQNVRFWAHHYGTGTGNTPRMVIQYNGFVGIGTTSPTQRLHVLTTGGSTTAPNIVATFQANTATTILAGGGTAIKFVGVSSGGNLQDYDQGMISTLGYADNNRHGMQFWVKPNASTVLTVGQTIDSNGNVGIGTTSPADKLSIVNGNISLSDSYKLYNGSANDSVGLFFSAALQVNISGYSGIIFRSSAANISSQTERMRITSDGFVGIGTSSPTLVSGYVGLNVVNAGYTQISAKSTASSAGIEFVPSTGYRWEIQADNSNNWFVYDRSQALHRLLINSNGSVGIGTTSPLERITFGSSDSIIARSSDTSFNSGYCSRILFNQGGTGYGYLGFYTYEGGSGGGERMRISETGNVGIGTTSPITKLHVAGTASIIPTYDSGSGYSYFLRMGYDTSGSYDYTIKRNGITGFLEFNGTQGSPYVSYVFAGGDVYSGASGGTIGGFYFNSSSHGIRRATGTNDVYCFTTSGTLYLGAGGSSTTHVRVLSGGDVGIGVSPSYKLDVNGNIHGTGFPTSSDVRFKKNITPLQNSLEKIKKLQGVKYEWNEFVNSRRDGYKLNIPIIGLIAQDVEQVVPEIVDHWKLSEDCQDARSIDYPRLIPLLIEAMKEQQNQIEELRNEIKSLKSN